MKDFEFLEDLVKILVPAAGIMYAMYLVVKSFLNKDFERRLVEMKMKNTDTILPIRLQAYERMALFLERITLHNLILSLNQPGLSAGQFQQMLLHQIREEYSHNMSQQIYMSDQAWRLIKSAMDEIMSIVNKAGRPLPPEARSSDLAKLIFDDLMQRQEDPVHKALVFIKQEIQKVF